MQGEQGNDHESGADFLPMDVQTYLNERVADQLKYYEGAANKAKKAHHWTQMTIIVFGVVVPVIVNLPETFLFGELKLVVTVMTLTIAILTGLANFRKWGDLWLSFRMTEELLKYEKFVFLTGSGDYQDRGTAFNAFVTKVESIVSAEHNKFRTLIEDARRPVKPAGS